MKRVLTYSLLTSLIGILTACGGGSGTSKPVEQVSSNDLNKSKQDYKGEITVWTWDLAHEKPLAEDFNKEYPNIKVNLVPVQDYAKKLQTALAVGSGAPDVVQLEENSAAPFVPSGQFEDLTQAPYLVDPSYIPKFLIKRYSDKDGHLVGLPNSINPAAMFYRRDLAKQYLGTDDPKEVGKLIGANTPTWDKFIDVGRKVKAASGGKVFLIAGLQDMYTMLSKQPKGAWHDGKKLLIKENILPEFQFLAQIRKEGLDAKLQAWSPSWNTSYSAGNVLLYPGADWYEQFILAMNDKDGNGRWGVTGNPVANWAWGGSAECIPKQSKHKDLAFQYIKWWTTTKAGAKSFFINDGALPANMNFMDDPVYNQPQPVLGGQVVGEFWKDQLNGVDVPAQDPNDNIASDAINQGLGKLDNGSATPEQAVDLIIQSIQSKLPDYKE